MNKQKIVFLDIDGTLYDNLNCRIPESSIRGLKEMHDQGDIDIVIATGRPNFMINHLDLIKQYIKAYVLLNGQFVLYENEVVHENALPVTSLKKLEEKARELNISMGFVGRNNAYITWMNDMVRTTFKQFNISEVKVLENGAFDYHMPVYEAWIFAPYETIMAVKAQIPEFDYMTWGSKGCDVVMKGSSKQDGIIKLIDKLHYDQKNTYAFGDGENDILMFRCCAHSIAMGNAKDEVKAQASMTTDAIDDDGLYKGLVRSGLIRK
jgi:Cof subfamily protein (haloacid dehalogenase superfamily)